MSTTKKIRAAEDNGQLRLAQAPVGTDADLFSGHDALWPLGRTADIVHWSHSDDKMWAALDKNGLLFSIHETRDDSDGTRSQLGPVSRKYCGRLDDVPERIAARVGKFGGYVATVNFATLRKILGLDDEGWERLK